MHHVFLFIFMYSPTFRTCEGQKYVYYVPICISLQLKDKYNECMNLIM